jgi:hypothetical protein
VAEDVPGMLATIADGFEREHQQMVQEAYSIDYQHVLQGWPGKRRVGRSQQSC